MPAKRRPSVTPINPEHDPEENGRAGGAAFYFTWDDGRLRRMPGLIVEAQGVRVSPETGRLEFLRAEGHSPHQFVGADVEVRVGIWLDRRGLYAHEVQISTIGLQPFGGMTMSPLPSPSPVAIDSALWRAIRIGELVDETIAEVRMGAHELRPALPEDDEWLTRVAQSEEGRARRGPRPSLTPTLAAEVVAPAYKSGGLRPVKAVRSALEAVGFPGSGPTGEVTIDQARKAVARSRDLGILPPAEKKGGRR